MYSTVLYVRPNVCTINGFICKQTISKLKALYVWLSSEKQKTINLRNHDCPCAYLWDRLTLKRICQWKQVIDCTLVSLADPPLGFALNVKILPLKGHNGEREFGGSGNWRNSQNLNSSRAPQPIERGDGGRRDLNLNISSLSCFGPIVIAWRSPFCTGRSGSDINALRLTMPGSLSDCM